MIRFRVVLVFLLLLFGASCAPTRFVEPIPPGHLAITASLGGPLVTFSNLVIPMPLTALTTGYGLDCSNTIFTSLHTTALMFKDFQVEIGGLHEFVPQRGGWPGVSATFVANVADAMRDGIWKFWPEVDVNAYWHYMLNDNLVYVGSSNWFELASTRSDGEAQTRHWLANFQIGHIFDSFNWQYVTEVKYLATTYGNGPNVATYHGISGHGSFGFYLAITRKF